MIFLLLASVNIPISGSAKTMALGPIAYWSFNDVKNNTVPDNSGDNLTGNLVNTTVIQGLNKQALLFNGYNSYMQVNDSKFLHFSNMSISMWFNPLTINHMARLIGKGSNSTESFGIFLSHDPAGFELYIFINQTIITSPIFTKSGEWNNLVFVYRCVYDQYSYFTYIDGKITSNNTINYPFIKNNTEPLILGIEKNPNGVAYPFNGSIDEVRIYNRAISADEALALYMVDRPVTSAISTVTIIQAPSGYLPLSVETTSKTNNIITPLLLNQIITLSAFSFLSVFVIIVSFTTAYYIRERKHYKKEGKSLTINQFIKKSRKKSSKRKEINVLLDKTLKDLESIIEENK